jgi:hypothetical protein
MPPRKDDGHAVAPAAIGAPHNSTPAQAVVDELPERVCLETRPGGPAAEAVTP